MQDTTQAEATDKNIEETLQKAKVFSIAEVANQSLALTTEVAENLGVFIVKKGSSWIKEASEMPAPKSLYFYVWFEGEVCIMYAETNVGKSILAVQIGLEIAMFCLVVYFDFELSAKQFQARYSNNFTNPYPFPDNFLRGEINPDKADYQEAGFNTLEDYINASIERTIIETGARVLIIDNLTYLRSETEKAKEALPLMKHLKALKNKYGLSILVLAHTPKRNPAQPISRNDLQGSKMLINFCDSAFALGESAKDKNLRYLKQIKSRNTEIVYDTENVAVFELSKPDNFLSFTLVHTAHEHEHLKHYSKEDKEGIVNQCIELQKRGYSQRQISKEIGISLGSVNNYINKV
jgi:hypothetical protein